MHTTQHSTDPESQRDPIIWPKLFDPYPARVSESLHGALQLSAAPRLLEQRLAASA